MAFLQVQKKNETARVINQLIAEADANITRLTAIKVELVSWSNTLAANTSDFNAADRAEFQAEMTRLTNLLNAL